jgi:hypothetical protein
VPSHEPGLTRELDEAEEAAIGRAETVVTEWGTRGPDPAERVVACKAGEEMALATVRSRARNGERLVLVRRTVTYGPREEVPGEHRD